MKSTGIPDEVQWGSAAIPLNIIGHLPVTFIGIFSVFSGTTFPVITTEVHQRLLQWHSMPMILVFRGIATRFPWHE